MEELKKLDFKPNRRSFIKNITLTSFGFAIFTRCSCLDLLNEKNISFDSIPPDPNNYLGLPPGFSYKIISKSGDIMDDGFFVPGRADGMGTFQGDVINKVVIVRNHENSPRPHKNSPFGPYNELLDSIDENMLYDAGRRTNPGLGGTTTLIYNESTQEVESQYLSLAGTYRNCAGGVTPWGSWLTCEEDVTKMSDKTEKDHGFIFEVPAYNMGLTEPAPILEMGRFHHEAVAVDPKSSIVYMTEDRSDGLFYRFIPNTPEALAQGGRLQVLSIKGKPKVDTRNWEQVEFEINLETKVEWLDIDNPLAPDDDLRYRGYENGATRFARGEGIWFGEGELYFTCTNGGNKKRGQIFRYRLSPDEGREGENSCPATLELFKESNDKDVLNMCDNLTITPWGDLMVCEDNGHRNRILQIKQDGSLNIFAINESSNSEFAGIVFSPSGNTLFVNIQENGETLAITGPWETIS
ncbi:alkaline phosphatase PhoX [Gramella sp. AN32]|uniref:Alkaline phosphatase PhoX n=1 Tax=Christiangramia antarctica TaxID=2058158 RepID=A0ABW5X473_9FLAO|nr:alkaline phosphatase PhoX [Gramella sp. AN32]MCM4157936.1 phosphatase [Gramella sp. AN32]